MCSIVSFPPRGEIEPALTVGGALRAVFDGGNTRALPFSFSAQSMRVLPLSPIGVTSVRIGG